jgi:purine-binding chemotaxis protein CheW
VANIHHQEKTLGQILEEAGLIRRDQLTKGLEEQRRSGEPLGRILVRQGLVSERDVINALRGLLVVSFQLGGEDFGVETLYVREIIRAITAIPVPQTPTYLEGIINIRNRVVPVVDLRKRLGLQPAGVDEASRIIICEMPNRNAGLLVDCVGAVMQLKMENIMDTTGAAHGIPAKYLYGLGRVGDQIITLLDLTALLESKEPIVMKRQSLPLKSPGDSQGQAG